MIVMKFGGTSVQDAPAIQRLVDIVRQRVPQKPVVVVSAMGKTTKHLLEAAVLASGGKRVEALKKLDAIRSDHHELAGQTVPGWNRTEAKKRLEQYFEEMRRLLDGLSILGELSGKSQDKMLSYGELMSTSIVDEVLRQNGLASVWMDSRQCILTDDRFTAASPLSEPTDEAVRKQIMPLLDQGLVPVLQGYIGSSLNGSTTTLGFEGSDFSASLIGASLDASEIQIWKDVPGVMTADPEMVSQARTVKTVTYQEAAMLTFLGAKVLHPKSLDPARKKAILLRVCNSRHPEMDGSEISNENLSDPHGVKSIAYKKPLWLMRLRPKTEMPFQEFYRSALEAFSMESVVPLFFCASENSIAAGIHDGKSLEAVRNALHPFVHAEIRSGKAAVSLVGENLTSRWKTAATVFSKISEGDVDLILFGTTGFSLTLVVEESVLKRVLNTLHDEVFQIEDSERFGSRGEMS